MKNYDTILGRAKEEQVGRINLDTKGRTCDDTWGRTVPNFGASGW